MSPLKKLFHLIVGIEAPHAFDAVALVTAQTNANLVETLHKMDEVARNHRNHSLQELLLEHHQKMVVFKEQLLRHSLEMKKMKQRVQSEYNNA